MSQVVAALILRTEANGRPTKDALEAAAQSVRALGFEVGRVGRRHLTVMGERMAFAGALGVIPEVGRNVLITGGTHAPLAKWFSSVEIAKAPEYY